MLLFAFSSLQDRQAMKTAITARYQNLSGDLSAELKEALDKCEIRLRVLGGAADNVDTLISNGAEGIVEWINRGLTYGPDSPAVPVSYTLRRVDTTDVYAVRLITDYVRRECSPTTGRFVVHIMYLECTGVDDTTSSSEEIYGHISVTHYAHGVEYERQIAWEHGPGNYVSMRRGERSEINKEISVAFPDFYAIQNDANIRVWGELREADDTSPDDNLGHQDEYVDVQAADGRPRELFWQDGGTRIKLVYTVGVRD
jgi:hypothetical protein